MKPEATDERENGIIVNVILRRLTHCNTEKMQHDLKNRRSRYEVGK